MAVVNIKRPESLNLSGNMNPFVLQNSAAVVFVLKLASPKPGEPSEILNETYYPGKGNLITIDVREVIEAWLTTKFPTGNMEQADLARTFIAEYDGQSYSFRVIRAGVNFFADTPANFLRTNFLTWQPQVKDVTYYSPEYLTFYATAACVLKLKAYFNDGTQTTLTLQSADADTAYTHDMQYGVVSGLLGNKYPSYYDVWTETTSGTRLSYMQRYVASEKKSRTEGWYLFFNSLGGIDTIRAYGEDRYEPSYEHNIAEINETSEEYRIDTERLHTRNTGRLSEREAKWMQDFFVSRQKFHHTLTGIRKIVVTENDASISTNDTPGDYTFTYHYAEDRPFLNLPRVEPLPATLTIPAPTGELFFLPPRLAEFPRHPLDNDLLIPANDPHEDSWSAIAFGAMVAAINDGTIKLVNDSYENAISFAERRFQDVIETLGMLENALFDKFTGSIQPIVMQTMSILVGDESLQFRFVNNKTNPVEVAHNVVYDVDTKTLTSPHGIIQHMTLGIDTISSSHAAGEYLFWDIPSFIKQVEDGSKSYYLYAKVSKTETTGEFLMSETAIKMESVEDYYHLLVGVLNSEREGKRSYVDLYGFVEILPGQIMVNRVVSADGQNFIDFLNNAFRIGNSATFLDYNTQGDGKMRLKGVFVQSESGDEQPLGCFRGEYNSTYTYYKGDEVTYQGSMYRFIYDTPQTGKAPTDTTYWILIAAGGENGSRIVYVYKSAATKPATPTGSTLPPSTWSLTPTSPTETDHVWMSQAEVSGAGVVGTWSVPIRISGLNGENGADGTDIEFIYRRTTNSTAPAKPATSQTDDYIPTNWTDRPSGVSASYLYEWVCQRDKTDSVWSEFSTPVVWAKWGEKGMDGDGYEYIYRRTTTESAPATPATSQTNDYIPADWTDDPTGVNASYMYEWVCVRDRKNGVWGNFSAPALWAKFGADGTNGSYKSFVFKKADTQPAAPTGTAPIPSGWVDAPTSSSGGLTDIGHNGDWVLQADGTRKSPAIDHNGITKNNLLFTTEGTNQTIQIYLKVSSEANYDWALVGLLDNGNLTISSNYTDRISGTAEKTITVNVPTAGLHGLQIAYAKDSSVVGGSDCAWYKVLTEVTSGDGTWWMSSATVSYTSGQWVAGTWSAPVRVTGEDGAPGADGKYWDYRYAVNATQPSTPSGLNPSGWSNTPPAVTTGNFLWMSFCEKNADGTEIIQGWSTPVRISGEKGQDGAGGAYIEYRYAKNGSTTSPPTLSSVTLPAPLGWTTAMPTIGVLEYLWMIKAKKSADGALLENWNTPVRLSGVKGDTGSSPALVFRGIYDSTATYYGTNIRVDAVKYNSTYYVARIDAGNGFTNKLPTNTDYWNSFGASFDSVATNLLLAENANIGDWFVHGGRIVSAKDGAGDNRIIIQVRNLNETTYTPRITVESAKSEGAYSTNTAQGAIIELDANTGAISAKSKTVTGRQATVAPSGIFCNNAETKAVSSTLGTDVRASIVGLGFGNVSKADWANENFIAGVYGTASNSGTAPAYGGFFMDLMAAGLLLNKMDVSDASSTVYLGQYVSLVLGLTNSGVQKTVYLPNDGIIGRIIFAKQIGQGSMRFYPRSGQYIYDDSTANDYSDISEGYMGVFAFVKFNQGGTVREAWTSSRFKW
ncbi:MAG: hypothetical protein LBQ39_01910 [Tannerellaceae bacterium]|jgi:hypothetical protein|nr:hypothetical protein [Tannerellaceae bacterium]